MVERMSQRFALALDLVDDAELIAQYEAWHQPGSTRSAKAGKLAG
jgi:hypothetical protein